MTTVASTSGRIRLLPVCRVSGRGRSRVPIPFGRFQPFEPRPGVIRSAVRRVSSRVSVQPAEWFRTTRHDYIQDGSVTGGSLRQGQNATQAVCIRRPRGDHNRPGREEAWEHRDHVQSSRMNRQNCPRTTAKKRSVPASGSPLKTKDLIRSGVCRQEAGLWFHLAAAMPPA